MRMRNVRPEFFKHEGLGELPPIVRLLFIGLWCLADRDGRLKDRAKRIKAEVLPYDEVDLDASLALLASRRFIQRYAAEGERYIAIPSWKKYQRLSGKELESKSEIPAPQGSTGEAPETEGEASGSVEYGEWRVESGERSAARAVLPQEEPATPRARVIETLQSLMLDASERAVDEWVALIREAKPSSVEEGCAFLAFAVREKRDLGREVTYARHALEMPAAWRQWARDRHWKDASDG
jgi:hypothetical protein